MRLNLVKNWWSLVIRGGLGILVGLLTFFWPGVTLAALVILFGAYSLVDGVFRLIGAVKAAETHERWGPLAFSGLLGIAAGVVTMAWPAITTLALVFVIGAWAVVTGVFEIMAAVRLRKHIEGEWLLALMGIASVGFGLVITLAPLAGALVIAIWVGAYALVSGVLLVSLGLRLRSWGRLQHHGAGVKPGFVPAGGQSPL